MIFISDELDVICCCYYFRTNCSRFGVEQPDFIAFKQMQEELDSEEKKWSIVEDFNNELQKIQDEDWIVFRKQLYKLNDFITQWEETLLHLTQNPLSTCLLQEIQKYKVIFYIS